MIIGLRTPGRGGAGDLSRSASGRESWRLVRGVLTDWYWRVPAIYLADAHTKNDPATSMCEFAWRSPQFNGRLGACHALEIAFVFDTLGSGTELLLDPHFHDELSGWRGV